MLATERWLSACTENRSSPSFEYTTLAGYDGGDCCSCTCAPDAYWVCGGYGYACIDPEAACVDDDDVTDDAIASNCFVAYVGDGLCNAFNNIEVCGMCWIWATSS